MNMKKKNTGKAGRFLPALLAVLLALPMLNACERGPAPESSTENDDGMTGDVLVPAVKDEGEEEVRHTYEYALKTTVLTDKADYEGTVVAVKSIELPVLYVVRADEGSEKVEAEKDDEHAEMFGVCDIFNARMSAYAEECDACYAETADLALKLCEHEGSTESILGTYSTSVSVRETFWADDLVSVYAEESVYTGGAHPIGISRTWNFDTRNGVFYESYADIAKDESEFTEILGAAITEKIYEEYGGYDYYTDFLENRAACLESASFAFTEGGMKICFVEYSVAPYAYKRIFDLPYSAVYAYLSKNLASRLSGAVPYEQKVLGAYFRANKLNNFFVMCSMPLDYSSEKEDEKGRKYQRVSYGGLENMTDLENLLLEVFTPECAKKILDSAPELYREFDGKLFGLDAARGSNITLGKAEYAVEGNEESGRILATVEDYGENIPEWNAETKTWKTEVEGYKTFEFPYVIKDGKILFTAFENIY